jgi:hypothetical protein
MGPNVAPALLPRPAVGDEGDPGIGAEPEVMAALANVGMLAKDIYIEPYPAPRTVGGERDRWQLPAGDPNLGVRLRQFHQRLKPPSTAST